MTISLDNIEEFKVPLDEYFANWIFKDENDKLASSEHQSQIFPLTSEAANFLWDYKMKIGIQATERYFKKITTYISDYLDQNAIRKYLYEIGIPFSHKVLIAVQPDTAFVLTWKMVIKYSHNLFWANDQSVWDKTLNWKLQFHHDGVFTFGEGLIYGGEKEKQKHEKVLRELENRKRRSSFD